MKYEINLSAIDKLTEWAELMPEDIDFVDYWFNLFKSSIKVDIDCDSLNMVHYFEWTRWKYIFEGNIGYTSLGYEDGYQPLLGNSYNKELRFWLAFLHNIWYMVFKFLLER